MPNVNLYYYNERMSMNTVTKKLFLALGLCFITVDITQPAEHTRAGSASDLLSLPKIESVESLVTVDPEDMGSIDSHNREEDSNNATQEVRRDSKGNLERPYVVLGAARFPTKPKEPKKVKLPREMRPKSKWAGCLSCLAK